MMDEPSCHAQWGPDKHGRPSNYCTYKTEHIPCMVHEVIVQKSLLRIRNYMAFTHKWKHYHHVLPLNYDVHSKC